jgi:NTE family protein
MFFHLILRYLCRGILLSALSAVTLAYAAEPGRLRVGLVLGGGGARGAAHIGVLETLHEMRVPVDCVAGTSMGALVAGAFASGMPPGVMRELLAQADWQDLFIDNPEFSEISHRSKELARRYLPGSESGLNAEGLHYQGGVVAGQKIKLFFNALVRSNQGEHNIESLPLPLSIIATDIGTGERVVLRDGSLSQAMRASMSVPGLLAPLDYRGRKLVDGGLVDNVPIAEVRERCRPDVVIAVNVGSPLLKADQVGSLLTVSSQMVNILTEQNVTRSLATLKPGDIYIKPNLEGISAGDFERNGEAAQRGRVATEALRKELSALAVDATVYAEWRQGIEVLDRVSPRIDEIQVSGLARVNPAVVERHLRVAPGDSVRRSVINRDLLRVYGDGYYESVDYSVLTDRERNILRVTPVEKSWGPDYLRFGLNLQADTHQGADFGLRAAYHNTWLNRLGGEFLATADIGSTNRLGGSFYQPLDAAQRTFVEASAGASQTRLHIYENDHRIAQYKSNETELGAYLGTHAGLLGPVRLGWEHRSRSFEVDVGSPALPRAKVIYGGWKASLDFDQFDRLYFPTRGWAAKLGHFDSRQAGYARTDAELRAAGTLGRSVLNGRLRYTGSSRGQLPIYDAAALGGFQNMTAFATGQILGDRVQYGGLRAEQIVGNLPLGLRGDVRFGLGLETARVNQRYTETQRSGPIHSASIYFGGETPFGPAYVGLGLGTGGVMSLFLFVGTP